MLRTNAQLWLVALLSLVFVACGGGVGKGPTLPGGQKVAVILEPDRNLTGLEEARANQVNQLADFQEGDLLSLLLKAGYEPARATDAAAQPGPGRYVLKTKIVKYNPGSAAARMWVGFGAGAASIDFHYDLLGPDGSLYTQGDMSVGSGRDWRKAARKVNIDTVRAVNARLAVGL
jgi:Domain of unknown function (DUF4410)